MDRLQAIVGITTYNAAIFQIFGFALHTHPNERVSYIRKWIKNCNREMLIFVYSALCIDTHTQNRTGLISDHTTEQFNNEVY
jgi:hypothetical protein